MAACAQHQTMVVGPEPQLARSPEMTANPAGNASFTAAFSVDQTPEEVFHAINNVRGWWSEDIEGPTGRAGGEFTQGKAEWNDTKIHFEIAAQDGKTGIRFTHVGLAPEYECFDLCSNSWSFYLHTSLRALIRTGKGLPNRKAQAASA